MTNNCTCSICERKARAVPGKRHRRCPGSAGQEGATLPILPKSAKLPKASRGIWEGPALASK